MNDPQEQDDSPWGTVTSVNEWVEGIWAVQATNHGGLKLNESRNAAVPDYMRRNDGWYEQDRDCCLAIVAHHKDFRGHRLPKLEQAMEVMEQWHPAAYARFFGIENGSEPSADDESDTGWTDIHGDPATMQRND